MGSLSHPPVRRVRHGVRDGLTVMAFSAASSVATAVLLTVALRLVASLGN